MNNYSVPHKLIDSFQENNSFILLGHKNPDGDCLSSQRALGSFLERLGKRVLLVSPGPFDRSEIENEERYFQKHIPPELKGINPLVVILDCSTIDRIGYLSEEIKGMRVAVIDHHDSGKSFGDIQYICPEAPSVTFLVHKIIESFNMVPNTTEAELLLFGLATDTGFFRHLESKSHEIFLSVAKLSEYGASPKDIHAKMYGGRTLLSKQLIGKLLSRTRSEIRGKLIISYETKEDLKSYGIENRDSDAFYQQVQGIKDVEAIALIRYESDTEISVGLRSRLYADVGAVAKSFGGGGHKKAAGFTWDGTAEEITAKLLAIFSKIL